MTISGPPAMRFGRPPRDEGRSTGPTQGPRSTVRRTFDVLRGNSLFRRALGGVVLVAMVVVLLMR